MSGHLTCALKDWYKERKHRGSKNYRFDAANACSLGSSEVSAKNVIDSRTAGILLVIRCVNLSAWVFNNVNRVSLQGK